MRERASLVEVELVIRERDKDPAGSKQAKHIRQRIGSGRSTTWDTHISRQIGP